MKEKILLKILNIVTIIERYLVKSYRYEHRKKRFEERVGKPYSRELDESLIQGIRSNSVTWFAAKLKDGTTLFKTPQNLYAVYGNCRFGRTIKTYLTYDMILNLVERDQIERTGPAFEVKQNIKIDVDKMGKLA